MKQLLLNQLKNILRFLARATIAKYEPIIIGITGSVGKTSTKEAIYAVLKDLRKCRSTQSNLNTDLGLPLTILGDWPEESLKLVSRAQPSGSAKNAKLFFWCKVICSSAWHIIRRVSYPEVIILEYGVQKPGDMQYLLSMAKPFAGIFTAIGEIPVHVEYFSGPEAVALEKGKLLETLPPVGFAVLNVDDEIIINIGERLRAHKFTFGFSKDAQVKITNFENLSTEDKPVGILFKLEYGGSFVPVKIEGVLGKTHAYAAAAAACVGLIFGSNLVKISESISHHYKPAKHRLNILEGIKNTYIIDDCYNAAPLSMHAALETLKSLPAKRKVAILGDMLELGKFAPEAHEEIGRLAAKIVDVLVTVGPRGKLIADGAMREGGMLKSDVLSFNTTQDAALTVQNLLKEGDLVLIKASRGIGLDKVVEEIKA